MKPTRITRPLVARALAGEARRPRATDLSARRESEARRLLAECCRAQTAPAEYIFRPQYTGIFRALTLWGLALEGTELDCRKGIWMAGSVGVGKSTLMRALKEYCRQVRQHSVVYPDPPCFSCWRIASAGEIASAYQTGGAAALEQYIRADALMIDDLGGAESVVNHYGTIRNLMEDIIMARYDYRDRRLTHVTTNLTDEQVRRLYGDRVYDRICEMFNFITLLGPSFRPEPARMSGGG